MKKLIFFILIFISCNLMSHEYKFIWDFNPANEYVNKYYIYPVVTDDSIRVIHDEVNFWKSFSHDSLLVINPDTAIVIYESEIDNRYLQFSIIAENNSGRSLPAYSNILRKTPGSPSQVLGAGILK